MKRFLSAGEGYGRSRGVGYKSIVFFFGLFLMCLQVGWTQGAVPVTERGRVVVAATAATASIKPLRVGDKLARKTSIGQFLGEDARAIVAGDLRGKAVIFDFWATWCGTCVANFQNLDSIQRVYKQDLTIILINNTHRSNDSQAGVEAFLETYQEKFPAFDLPVVLATQHFGELFPARFIPHYVWVDANGRVKAITGGSELTAANIRRFVAGLSLDLKTKAQ